jgi:hypothetical protein
VASPQTLLVLASRCEEEKPSEALRDAIAVALGWVNLLPQSSSIRWRDPSGTTCYGFGPPDYVNSLDAASSIASPKCIVAMVGPVNGTWLANVADNYSWGTNEAMARTGAALKWLAGRLN